MTALKGLLTLGLGLVTSLSMAATPAKPPTNGFQDVKVFMDAVHSGQIDPETYDFGAAGFYELEPMQRMHWQMLIFEVVTQSYPPSISECSRIRQQNGGVMAWTQIAAQSKDAADWKANAGMLRTRLAELDQALAKSAPATASKDPLVQELLVRFARDQDVREMVFAQKKWVEGLPKVAADNWTTAAVTRMTAIDCDNTAWLKKQLPRIGWFTIPKYGEEADTAAWHLVQHADREPSFQREMLAKLQALPPGQTDGKRLAYLHDRVARAEGRPQRYGTQGICRDGQWDPNPIEDPDHLDERRASLGMKPESEAVAINTAGCTRH